MQTGNEAKVKNHFTTVASGGFDWSLLHTAWLKLLSGTFDVTWVNGVKQENVSSTERAWKKKEPLSLTLLWCLILCPSFNLLNKKKKQVSGMTSRPQTELSKQMCFSWVCHDDLH